MGEAVFGGRASRAFIIESASASDFWAGDMSGLGCIIINEKQTFK
jgi:hypothetical protein